VREGAPKKDLKLEKTGVGPGGYPVYEVSRHTETVDEGAYDLPKPKRKALRAILASIGISLMPMKEGNDAEAAYSDFEEDRYTISADENFNNPENLNTTLDDLVDRFKSEIDEDDIYISLQRATEKNEDLGTSLAEYLESSFKLRNEPDLKRGRPAVPKAVEDEIRQIILAQAIQESRLDSTAVSSSGARGYFQFKPATAQDYINSEAVPEDIASQVFMTNEHISNNYHYILHFAGEETINKLKQDFNSEDEYNKLLSLLLTLSHNYGGPGTGRLVKSFYESGHTIDPNSGAETFMSIINYAHENIDGFGQEQLEYVPRIYAWADITNSARG
jgi:hypothetical protein